MSPPSSPFPPLSADDLALLQTWRDAWTLAPGVTYLNHGSFGPSPLVVQQARNDWSAQLEAQPMDFFVRQMEEHLDAAAARLGDFVGCAGRDLIFCDNATFGMNIVAHITRLEAGDEVLLTNHEYGAVQRIWRHACQRSGARLAVVDLPEPMTSADEVCERIFAAVAPRTRLLVVSHVTSPTATILPVRRICSLARERDLAVCIDGPHAPGMVPVNLRELGCDYYVASCHKWLSAPFGTGFLYASQARQSQLKSPVVSWGGSVSGRPAHWKDEFQWWGTRDPAGFLAVPAAIDFLESVGLDAFRKATHALAEFARRNIEALTQSPCLIPNSGEWYGSMIALPLPPPHYEPPERGRRDPLQHALWERFQIEIPIVHWQRKRFIRVSCHLYNTVEQLERLFEALAVLLPEY